MKKISLFAFFLLQAVFAWAQGVTISGRVANPQTDTVMLAIAENPFDSRENVTLAPLNEKGEFSLTLNLKHPVLADLVNGNDLAQLFLQPGDNLAVKFSGESIVETIKFEGKGAAENNYLKEFEIKFEINDGYQVLPDNIYLREPGFIAFLDDRKQAQEKFFQKYLAKNPLSEAFKQFARSQIEYSYANDLITYPDLREQIVFAEKRPVMSAGYYNFISKLNLNDKSNLLNPVYNEFTENYIAYLAGLQKLKKTDLEYYQVCYNLAKEKFSGQARELLQARFIYQSCKNGHVGFTEKMLENFTKTYPANIYLASLRQTYEANRKFALGAPAPEFTLTTVTGQTVSLQDFRGKLVYLSFWETNSGLCLMDMPHSQELIKRMQGKDIVFLHINLDASEKAWREMVTKKQLLGVHAYGKSGATNLSVLYELKETPTYFLIAEDGTFLNTKPKRPSSHGITEEIAQAFGKAANTATALKK